MVFLLEIRRIEFLKPEVVKMWFLETVGRGRLEIQISAQVIERH